MTVAVIEGAPTNTRSPFMFAAPATEFGGSLPSMLHSHFPDDRALSALIEDRVAEGRATGIVLGVLHPDGTRRIVAHGDPGPDARPLSAESVFEIGSITKVFTGILLAEMA